MFSELGLVLLRLQLEHFAEPKLTLAGLVDISHYNTQCMDITHYSNRVQMKWLQYFKPGWTLVARVDQINPGD